MVRPFFICDTLIPMVAANVGAAFSAWRTLLGDEKCKTETHAFLSYQVSTIGDSEKEILGVLFPENTEEVVKIVKIAARYHISLYPISIGNNWGYGSRVPTGEGCVVVDLSRLNKILAINKELGLIALEPGVTTQQLHEYLIALEVRYMSPLSTAGPEVSVVGNVLDRGNGSSGFVDRFASLIDLEAVLSDGTIYRSAFRKKTDASNAAGFFKWGIGPYIDGLFGQNGLGIVTQMTIALAPQSERIEVFIFKKNKVQRIAHLITSVQNAFFDLGTLLGGVRIQSPRSTYSRLKSYTTSHLTAQGILDDTFIRETLKRDKLDDWLVLGILQGTRETIKAARVVLCKKFPSNKILFLNTQKLIWIRKLHSFLPARLLPQRLLVVLASSHLRSVAGETVTQKPRLPNWKQGKKMYKIENENYDLNPSTGFIFCSVVLPMSGFVVKDLVALTEETCASYSIEPLISLSNFSDRSLRMSLPILFDKSNAEETRNAHACYRELFEKCKAKDIHVYRAPTSAMDMVVDMEHPFWQTAEKIKKALDPDNIMSPGRYSKYKAPHEGQL